MLPIEISQLHLHGGTASAGLMSRVQRLEGPLFELGDIFLKRDDELGDGISGTKERKYSQLLPSLRRAGVRNVVALGSVRSNNLVCLARYLRQEKIGFHFLIRGQKFDLSNTVSGRLLERLCDPGEMTFIARDDWDQEVGQMTVRLVEDDRFLIPEGAYLPKHTLFGSMTLGADCLKNEGDLGIRFDSIFIDSGSGVSAIGLILYYGAIGRACEINILPLGIGEQEFRRRLSESADFLAEQTATRPTMLPAFRFLPVPPINRALIDLSREIERSQGFLLGDFYSARLLAAFFAEPLASRRCLIIHSGGALATNV
jgi:1-aminocyclopropane-1-carboxylate deaminase